MSGRGEVIVNPRVVAAAPTAADRQVVWFGLLALGLMVTGSVGWAVQLTELSSLRRMGSRRTRDRRRQSTPVRSPAVLLRRRTSAG